MKQVEVNCYPKGLGSGSEDFQDQMLAVLPKRAVVVRGSDSYLCYVNDDSGMCCTPEIPLLPAVVLPDTSKDDPDVATVKNNIAKQGTAESYSRFFQGVTSSYKGTINVPEAKDFGLAEAAPQAEAPPEAASVAPSESTSEEPAST